jgi:structural maintenance of chromosome 2
MWAHSAAVQVAFGKVWKETLTELSGGQRSLLALSLILSLLLFKPAPMYILDEVDAALDLSHTQNIGNMLRTYFSHSQFIVVSLKEVSTPKLVHPGRYFFTCMYS